MKHKLTYITALLLLAASCSRDDIGVDKADTAIGVEEKTPIEVTALLDAGTAAKTRAADMTFAVGDQLLAYLRHVKWDGSTGVRTSVTADQAPRLVTFTKGSDAMTAYAGADITPIGTNTTLGLTSSNTQQTANLTASPILYWDDFSANSANDGTESSTYLRDTGHYLQSYYGYCYNGGTPSTALVNETGVLGWAVQTDQSGDKSAFLHSDLLWSAEQTPIQYQRSTFGGSHGTLVLPYTHAMSKVTINVTVDEGFAADFKLTDVTTTLNNMFTKCTCTAPTYTLSDKGTTAGTGKMGDITMWQGSTETNKQCTYEAIVVPSILSIGNNLATISGVLNNDYAIPVTEAILHTPVAPGEKGWGAQLTETTENIQNGTAQAAPRKSIAKGKGYEMKSGVNYVLNVTLSLQGITVSALIKDWVNVDAIGEGKIQFTSDVTEKGTIAEELKTGGFDVYKNSTQTFTTVSTAVTWNDDKWSYTPAIYWADKDDQAYFRALSPSGTTTSLTQGNDILWGFACDATGSTVSDAERAKIGEGSEVKITPRTGDVPLHFEHAMSKITVNLETPSGDPSSPTSAAVNLTGATIEISDLATTGTIELLKGGITPGATVAAAIAPTTAITNYAVIPQTITNASILKVTLTNGTTYKLQLNTCKVQTGTDGEGNPIYAPITTWQRGKHYNYTIHIEKEAITFRALIKDWDETSGSGNATLEWD